MRLSAHRSLDQPRNRKSERHHLRRLGPAAGSFFGEPETYFFAEPGGSSEDRRGREGGQPLAIGSPALAKRRPNWGSVSPASQNLTEFSSRVTTH